MRTVGTRIVLWVSGTLPSIAVGECDKENTLGERGEWHVSGVVTDSLTGEPIDSVLVTIGDSSDSGGAAVYTNSSGYYRIDVPILICDVTGSKNGYRPQTRGFYEFQPDNIVSGVDFELQSIGGMYETSFGFDTRDFHSPGDLAIVLL